MSRRKHLINKITPLKKDVVIDIENKIRSAILQYVKNFTYKNTQPLDLLIPNERKIRSVVGGLETSMGTMVWEPVALTLAKSNGFKVLNKKILRPDPFPEKLASELYKLIHLRENRNTWINTQECITRLKLICKKLNSRKTNFVPPSAGTGVDLYFEKNGIEYAFDIKTVQPNVGSIKSFNKQLLEWYAYRIFKKPEVIIECKIAYPYNPYSSDFWTHSPHNRGILQPKIDAVVENEFWDFLSGINYTYQQISAIFMELNKEGFGKELSKLIKSIQATKIHQVS